MKIAPNIYVVQGLVHQSLTGVNAGFFVAGDKLIYVDSGWLVSSAQTIYGYSKAAAPLASPHMAIFTDKHLDQISGMRVFHEEGAMLVGHEKLGLLLKEDLIKNYQTVSMSMHKGREDEAKVAFRDVLLYPLDRYIGTEEIINFGETAVHIIPTPGHSNACLSVYLPQSKILFAGDAVSPELDPVTCFGDKEAWEQWIKSLEYLYSLEIDKIVPSHGRVCEKSVIRKNIEYLAAVIEAPALDDIDERR